jgi:penicillin amidase
VALQWTALQPGRTADAIWALDTATTFTEFRHAASLFEVPAQNLVYADVDGNIGYQAPGKIPVRGKGDGTYPVPGWDSTYDWTGYIPFNELPWVENPPDGWIVTANQAVIGPQYQHFLTADWDYGFRSQRIMDMITAAAAAGPITVAAVQAMQFDDRSSLAGILVPALLAAPASATVAQTRDELLAHWDYRQPAYAPAADSAAAAFFNATWRHLLSRVFGKLPTGHTADGSDRWWVVLHTLLQQPDSPWWSSAAGGPSRDQVLAAAMSDAVTELSARLGSDPTAWRWGDIHQLALVNQSLGKSGIAPIEWLFNRGPGAVAGGNGIVDATSWSADATDNPYTTTVAPSMRMVVDLSNLDNSWWIQLTGNSGHAFSPNYSDQFDLWRAGQYLPMRWDDQALKAAATHTLTLTP